MYLLPRDNYHVTYRTVNADKIEAALEGCEARVALR